MGVLVYPERVGDLLASDPEAEIGVPKHEVLNIAGKSALLVQRFDRSGMNRHPYTSAAPVLGYAPSTFRPENASYAEPALSVAMADAATASSPHNRAA